VTAREQDAGDGRVDQPVRRESRDRPLGDKDRYYVDAAFPQGVEYLAVVAARDFDLRLGIGIAKLREQILEVGSVGTQLPMGDAPRLAAALKLRSSATATKYRRWRNSICSLLVFDIQ